MKLSLVLFCSDDLYCGSLGLRSGGPRRIAQTTHPAIIREIIKHLHSNRELECDEHDIFYEPAFVTRLPEAIHTLTAQIRADAIRPFLVDPDEYDIEGGMLEHELRAYDDEGSDA